MILVALMAAVAAQGGPAKLIVMVPDKPAMTIDYPTMGRCNHARAELLRQTRETEAASEKAAADLAKQLGRSVFVQRVAAYCIPG